MCVTDSAWSDLAWAAAPKQLAPGAGPDAVAAALGWIETLSERQAWPAKKRLALTLCADEALTNIAAHARTPEGQAARIWLTCGTTDEGLALCIQDDGVPFDPTRQASPPLAASLDEAQMGGHGLRLMRHYLRRLRYRREGQHNVLMLEV